MLKRRLPLLILILFAAAMRAFPALAQGMLECVQLPLTRAIARLTSRSAISFAWILLLACALLILFRKKGVLIAIAALYLFIRFPAVCAPKAEIQPATTEAIGELSDCLIDALNASALRFPDSETALSLSIAAVNAYSSQSLGDHAIKFAPAGLMNRLQLAGIYIPFTAEAYVNPALSAEALPFAAIHELTHRLGIADEAQSNLTAWAISIQSGGALADSARLWALRYSMARLYASDFGAWTIRIQRMTPEVRASFQRIGGNAALNPNARYSLLADALCGLLFSGECDTIQQREGIK